jgi:ribosomal-protein-alanine N-acetyltransferase
MTRIPSLETARLILRPFTAGDLDDLAEILADPEVVRYLPGGQPKTRQQAEATLAYIANHWETRGFGWWAAVLKADNKLAGWCGLKVFENTPEVELLYLLAKAYWNQGLASEAARASLRYGFEELKLERVVAFAVAGNRASTRVMEKVGMQFEQTGRFYNLDGVCYALSRETFQPDGSFYQVLR